MSAALSGSPAISSPTNAECLSPEIWPELSASNGDSTFAIASSGETPAMTDCTVLWNAGSAAVSVRLWMRTASPAGCLKSS